MGSNPKRPAGIPSDVWQAMQHMRNGVHICKDFKYRMIYLSDGGSIGLHAFQHMRARGYIVGRMGNEIEAWRLSDKGHDIAAGDARGDAGAGREGGR